MKDFLRFLVLPFSEAGVTLGMFALNLWLVINISLWFITILVIIWLGYGSSIALNRVYLAEEGNEGQGE